MRNDSQDDIDDLPKITSERKEPRLNTSLHTTPIDSHTSATTASGFQARSNKALGVLSALTIAIACSSSAFAWWSMQRMQLLEQQLVATQDSFSKIYEDAAGRINAITGTVNTTQNTVLSDNEALKKRLSTLENRVVDNHKQQQIGLTENASRLSKLNTELAALAERSSSLNQQFETQQAAALQQDKATTAAQAQLSESLAEQHTQLQNLHNTLASNQQQLAQLKAFDTRINDISATLDTLQKSTKLNDDIARIQQNLLILRSQVDNQPTAVASNHTGPSLADFDAYRAQTNRTITALQKQVRNLQENTP